MIQRSWRARATTDGAPRYAEHLTGAVLPKMQRLDGFLGLVLSQRRQGKRESVQRRRPRGP